MLRRNSAPSPGAGASSMTFWWRRWIEQSRSNRSIAWPCRSAKTWISTWHRFDVFLDQHVLIGKGALGLAPGGGKGGAKFLGVGDDAHAAAAAAGDRLDQHRKAEAVRFRGEAVGVLVVSVIALNHRHPGSENQSLGRRFRAHRADRGRRRPDKDEPGLRAGLGKRRVF